VLIWKVRLSLKRQSHLRVGRKALETRLNDYRMGREERSLYPLNGDRGFYPRGAGFPGRVVPGTKDQGSRVEHGRPATKSPEELENDVKRDFHLSKLAVVGLPKFNKRITPRIFLKEGTGERHKHPPLKGRTECEYSIYPLRDFIDYTSRIKSMEYSAYTLLEHVERKPWSKTKASVLAIKTLSYCYDAVRGYLVSRSSGGPNNLLKLKTPVFRFLKLPLYG
jgi:hypothetical protein